MRPFDEIPFEESDYSDVALLVASVREWPDDDFARALDARVERRFAPEAAPAADRQNRSHRGRLSAWMAGPAVALVAGAAAAVFVLSGGGSGAPVNGSSTQLGQSGLEKPVVHGLSNRTAARSHPPVVTTSGVPTQASGSGGVAQPSNQAKQAAPLGADSRQASQPSTTAGVNPGGPVIFNSAAGSATSSAPVAPGAKQIRSAEISLTAPNEHVNQVSSEVFAVVSTEHGIVLSSHITTATRSSGGGYAWFSLSIPTGNLQDAMTQLSRLHYAALESSSAGSQNVSNQYNSDQRQLADAKALRASLLKQLQTAYTQQAIDSIKAQLKLAEQQINRWQATLDALNHRISFSSLTVQINADGLPPVPLAHKPAQGGSFTIGRAGHDALRVLVVAAGVGLIALAVAIPVGLVAALLVWLWVWLRQRRREHALDAAA